MIKDFLLIIVLIIFLIPSVSAVVINEIMYDPNETQGGIYNEWIEIYNPTENNITLNNWNLSELTGSGNEKNHSIPLTTILSGGYLILARNNLSFLEYFCDTCKVVEVSFGSGLNNNDPEIIKLYFSNGSLVDEVYYNNSFGANNDGNTLQLCNGTFISHFPTPGSVNNCSQQGQQQEEETIELDYPSKVDCNEEFSVEIKAHNFEDDIYDVKIDVLGEDEENIEGKVWDPDEDKWQSTTYYVYEILDVSGGEGTADLKFKIEDYEGEAILRPRIRNSETKTSEQFDDYPIDVICDIQEESEIKIIDAPEEARFGDEIKVEIEVYRGDTAKYAVYVYVQDNNDKKVSNEINLHFDDKFETKTEMIELILKCKNEQGTYEIIAEGLDTKDKENIDLDFCEEQDEKTEETTSKSNTQETTTTTASTSSNYYPVTSNSILESDNFLISKIMPYILASISLLLVIYLIIKKI